MSDILEAAETGKESRLNAIIALSVAIIATVMALGNIKDGNIGQSMAQAQSNAVDTWAQYQSKSTKQNIAEAALAQLTLQRDLATGFTPEQQARIDKQIATFQQQVKRYDTEKAEIRKQAEAYQHEYDALNIHDDQFDLSEAALSVAIAILGVTALTQKRWLLVFGLVFAGIGLVFSIAGFFNLSLHPAALTSLFS